MKGQKKIGSDRSSGTGPFQEVKRLDAGVMYSQQ